MTSTAIMTAAAIGTPMATPRRLNEVGGGGFGELSGFKNVTIGPLIVKPVPPGSLSTSTRRNCEDEPPLRKSSVMLRGMLPLYASMDGVTHCIVPELSIHSNLITTEALALVNAPIHQLMI